MADNFRSDDDQYRPSFDRASSPLQLGTVHYYLRETTPHDGLVRDRNAANAAVSIATVGMAPATTSVVSGAGVVIREFATGITLKRRRYLLGCPRGPGPDAASNEGHFHNSSTSRPAAASGSAGCRPSTRHSRSPAR